jgi:hypothetical protein
MKRLSRCLESLTRWERSLAYYHDIIIYCGEGR